MPDLDKIRADIEFVATVPGRPMDLAEWRDAEVVMRRVLVTAPELLAEYDRLTAEHRQLADRLREAVAERDALLADAGPEAHPPVDGYWVEVYDPVDSDLPSEGWMAISSKKDTASEAADAMRRRRELRPTWGPLRVLRIRKLYAVVAVEEPDPAPPGAGVCVRCGTWEAAPEVHTGCPECGNPWGRIEPEPPADALSCPPEPPHPASAPPAVGP